MSTAKIRRKLTHGVYFPASRGEGLSAHITRARRGRTGGGRRIAEASLSPEDLGLSYSAMRSVLAEQEGVSLPPDIRDLPPDTYIPTSAPTATQLRLLIAAVRRADSRHKARRLADAIGDMHDCEAGWWHACLENRHRPRRVLDALELMYA